MPRSPTVQSMVVAVAFSSPSLAVVPCALVLPRGGFDAGMVELSAG